MATKKAVWQGFVKSPETGKPVSGAEVRVFDADSGAAVTLYGDRDGAAGPGNPFFTGSDGFAQFYVDPSRIRIEAYDAGQAAQFDDVLVGTLDEGGIVTANLADGSITEPKLADNAVSRRAASSDIVTQVADYTELKALAGLEDGTAITVTTTGRAGDFVVIGDAADFAAEIAADPEEGVYVVTADDKVLERVDRRRPVPEWYGAVGDGVPVAGIFSGTDDTAPIQAWLNHNKEYWADPNKVYMVGNLTFPFHGGDDVRIHTNMTFAFAGAADTSYGMAPENWVNNTTTISRGPKMGGNVWTFYGNDHVDNGFRGIFFDARCNFKATRCLSDGIVLDSRTKNGTTNISSTAVDNIFTVEMHDNGGNGLSSNDPASKITDVTLRVEVSEGNGGYDVFADQAAGWLIDVERNYGSAGGVYIGLASAATRVHFGQGDSGSATPSGSSGWGFYLQDILTSGTFDQASGFVTLTGHLNYAVSTGGLVSGSGPRGIDAQGLHLNTENGYFLLSQLNPAVRILCRDGVMSESSWTAAFGTSGAPFRFSASNVTARYHVSNTLVSALNYMINSTILDANGVPILTISSGAITVPGGGFWRIDTEGGAGTDDLDTINGLIAGENYTFSLADNSHHVVFKDNTGNIRTPAGDLTLNNGQDIIFGGSATGGGIAIVALGDNA